eukprot:jgi/Undpi1/3217/HiC_scaffold_15.g06591.m1
MSLNSTAAEVGKDGERTRLNPTTTAPIYGNNGRSEPPTTSMSARTTDVEQTSSYPMGNDDHEDDDYETATLTDVKKAAVFGALDGVLTSFAVVAGAAGGGLSPQTILIVGISSIVADGLSMGLGEYLSTKAMNDYMEVERKRQEWGLAHHRQGEMETMITMYMRRGMSHEDAQEISSRLSKYDDCFVDAMMSEEVGSRAAPLDEGGSIGEGLVTFISFALAGALPLLVYAFSPLILAAGGRDDGGVDGEGGEMPPSSSGWLFLWACLVTSVALFAIGIIKATFVARAWLGSGVETLVLGGCCAGLAYEIGTVVASCVKVMD